MKPYNSEQTKKEEIREMFNNIAPTYDRLNHTLSFNIDKLWRRRVVKLVQRWSPKHILDVATGTGDLAIQLALHIKDADVCGIDLSEKMLEIAIEKVEKRGLKGQVTLCVGDAEHLCVDSASVDVVTVAFGVRNFENLSLGLKEIARTIKIGGRVVILEFSTPKNRLFGALYRFYNCYILPRVGVLISKDRSAYEYLPASVEEFPSPDKFMEIMVGAGFKNCSAKSQSFGIAQIYIGEK